MICGAGLFLSASQKNNRNCLEAGLVQCLVAMAFEGEIDQMIENTRKWPARSFPHLWITGHLRESRHCVQLVNQQLPGVASQDTIDPGQTCAIDRLECSGCH